MLHINMHSLQKMYLGIFQGARGAQTAVSDLRALANLSEQHLHAREDIESFGECEKSEDCVKQSKKSSSCSSMVRAAKRGKAK